MLEVLLSPLPQLALLALGLFAAWRWLLRWLRVVGVALGLLLAFLCTPWGANLLVRAVERQVPPAAHCASGDHADIVLLAGGHDRAPRQGDDYGALTWESWQRLHGAIRLWADAPGANFWIAGGGDYAVKESEVLATLARAWGVDAGVLRIEPASTTTWESAEALRGQAPARVRLITSASHLPRAMVAFRAMGFQPCGWASHSVYLPARGLGALLPQASAVDKAAQAQYELAGMLQYRWRARKRH